MAEFKSKPFFFRKKVQNTTWINKALSLDFLIFGKKGFCSLNTFAKEVNDIMSKKQISWHSHVYDGFKINLNKTFRSHLIVVLVYKSQMFDTLFFYQL